MGEKLTPKPKGQRRDDGGKFARKDVDWELAEQFFVQGEIIIQKNKQGDLERKKPTYSDIARRFKTSTQLVGYHAKRRNWRDKRTTWERMAAKLVADEVAKSRALSMGEATAILDSWLLKFKEQLDKDRVRVDSLADFNTAVRLKGYIENQGGPEENTNGGPNLRDLQDRHREVRRAAGEFDDRVTGVVGQVRPDLH